MRSLEGEEEETSCGSPKSKLLPMNLLDEYWFFHNALHAGGRRVVVPQTVLPLPLPNKSTEMSLMSSIQQLKAEKSSVGDSFADRALLRAPSPPPPPLHAGRKETAAEEENDEEVDVPRTSSSSSTPNNNKKPPLLRAPSMPSPQNSFDYFDTSSSSSSSKKNLMRNASVGRNNRVPRRHMRKCCCCTSLHHNCKTAFREKKWRSSSDLESIEVQGFKDLGFVFDEVGLNDERLASVIPGLREKKANVDDDDDGGSSDVKRPYLSEVWNAQRPAPPTLKWVAADKRSPADMKEQLRFWARAVACNVRQEC